MAAKPAARKLRIATWNINSLRLRQGLLQKLVDALDPDVLCLQETKVPDDLFPHNAPAAVGYDHVAFRGMKGYNGVAVLSRIPMVRDDDAPDWCLRGDCRHLGVTLALPSGPLVLHDFYVPAGGDVPDREVNPKFGHKLDFVDEATAWFAARRGFRRTVIVGDLNIAPLEHDVWSHKSLLSVVSHTPIEVDKLTRAQAAGPWVDALRKFVPDDEKLYTWWSYRSPDWQKANKGRRLDHIWVSPALSDSVKWMRVLRDARGWERPSDHAPVMVSLEL
jgi:exodeoxyribonuclease-3